MFYGFTSIEFTNRTDVFATLRALVARLFTSSCRILVTNRTDVFATLRALVARLFTSSCRILVIILANWTELLGKFSRIPRQS